MQSGSAIQFSSVAKKALNERWSQLPQEHKEEFVKMSQSKIEAPSAGAMMPEHHMRAEPRQGDNSKHGPEITSGVDAMLVPEFSELKDAAPTATNARIAELRQRRERIDAELAELEDATVLDLHQAWIRGVEDKIKRASEPRQQSSEEVKTMPEEIVNNKNAIEITADGATKIPLNQVRSSESIDAMPEREDSNKRGFEVTPGGDVTMPEHHMRTEPRHQSPEKVQAVAKRPPSSVRSEPQQQSSWVRSEPRQQSSGEAKTMREELVNHKKTIEITADGATKTSLNQVRSEPGIDAMPEREDNNKRGFEVTPGGDVTMPEHHMRTESRHQSPE